MRKRISLGVGLAATAIVVAAVMWQSPAVLSRTNAAPIVGPVAAVAQRFEACQGGEVLPAGTTAVRLSLEALIGPPVLVRVLNRNVVLASGSVGAGWSRQSVTVPLKPLSRTVTGVSVCFEVAAGDETVYAKGAPSADADAGTEGRIRIEYLRPGGRSWWALAPSIVQRMALGRAPGGVWVVLLALSAMLALAAVVSWLAVRDPS